MYLLHLILVRQDRERVREIASLAAVGYFESVNLPNVNKFINWNRVVMVHKPRVPTPGAMQDDAFWWILLNSSPGTLFCLHLTLFLLNELFWLFYEWRALLLCLLLCLSINQSVKFQFLLSTFNSFSRI